MAPREHGDRTSFAGSTGDRDPREPERHVAAAPLRRTLRLAAAPLVAIGAALAGLLFVILLPVCGLASVAEALARAGWRFVRAAAHPALSRPMGNR